MSWLILRRCFVAYTTFEGARDRNYGWKDRVGSIEERGLLLERHRLGFYGKKKRERKPSGQRRIIKTVNKV